VGSGLKSILLLFAPVIVIAIAAGSILERPFVPKRACERNSFAFCKVKS
jgi:hypothetical protein